MNDFGEIFRRIRESRGMTLEEMANYLETTKQALSRYERGERTPKITVAARFADKLGIPIETLVGCEPRDTDKTEEPFWKAATPEINIVSGMMEKMTKEQQEQVVNVLRAMFANHPELLK